MLFSTNTQHSQAGFSLVELLIVVAIIGILAAVAAPLLLDARVASRRAAAISSLRLMHTAEHNYFMQNSRYATLSELNSFQGGGLGSMTTTTEIFSNGYTYQMVPPSPSTASLSAGLVCASAVRARMSSAQVRPSTTHSSSELLASRLAPCRPV